MIFIAWPILESKGMCVNFQKNGTKMTKTLKKGKKKKAIPLKIWAKIYKI